MAWHEVDSTLRGVLAAQGYEVEAVKRPFTGQPVKLDGKPVQLWGPAHGCGTVVLTSNGHALSATIGGLCLTDVNTGKRDWNTDGFASYTCPHPIAANGRIFCAPQTSGI